jgi:exodeoxyribonuclease V beta subunit
MTVAHPALAWVDRPAALHTLDLKRPLSVEASAGTGKTWFLQHLVAELIVEGHARIDEIVVLTFTERAAAELRRRVRSTLEDVVAATPSSTPPPQHAWIVDDVRRRRAVEALRSFDDSLIGTIHHFCLTQLKEQGVLVGLPAILGDDIVDDPFPTVWRSVVRGRLAHDTFFRASWSRLPEPTREQYEVAVRTLSTTRLPTRPTVTEIQALAESVVRQWRDLGRPTMPTTGEHPFHDDPRVGGHTGSKPVAAYLGWSQAFFAGLAAADTVGWEAVCHYIEQTRHLLNDDGNGRPRLDAAVEGTKKKPWCKTPEQAAFLGDARTLLTHAWAVMPLTLAEEVATETRRRLDDRSELTYDEMVRRLRDALIAEDTTPHTPLRDALRARFKAALVDEFQDTDETQWDIFRTLFLGGRCEHRATAAGLLVVVGDPKQAIYRFRGADFAAYHRACSTIRDDFGGAELALDENHRSTSELVQGVGSLLGGRLFNPARDRITLPVVTAKADVGFKAPDAMPALVAMAARLPDDGSLGVDAIRAVHAASTAAEIGRLVREGTKYRPPRSSEVRQLAYRDICVVGRGKYDLDKVAGALRRSGIPFSHYKKRGLYQTAEALDLLDVMLGIENPSDPGCVMRALATPFFGAAPQQLAQVMDLDESHPWRAKLTWLHERAFDNDIPGVLRALERDTGVIPRLLFMEGQRSATNVEHLLEELGRTHAKTAWSWPRHVEEVRRQISAVASDIGETDLLRLESERDQVTLMTMHMSKGLEFPVVFLAGGYLGREQHLPRHPVVVHAADDEAYLALHAPDVAALWRTEEEQEDARLLYVALTRARCRVYMPWTNVTIGRGFRPGMYERLWPFLSELGHGRAQSTFVSVLEPQDAPDAPLRFPGDLSEDEEARLAQFIPPTPAPNLADDGYRAVVYGSRRGRLVTSYTALKRHMDAQGVDGNEGDVSDESSERVLVLDDNETKLTLADERARLPGGAKVGIVFHEALERIDLAGARKASTLSDFTAIAGPVLDPFARIGFNEAQQHAAAETVWHTLHRPLAPQLPPIVDIDNVLREVDFQLPLPEEAHAALGQAPLNELMPFRSTRGFLVGSMDVVLRHKGRAYFLDWKSDVVSSLSQPDCVDFSPDRLSAYVDEAYSLQREIYTVALLRFLGIVDEADYEARFGGVLYVFLRPFGAPDHTHERGGGVVFGRPSFAEAQAYEEKLRSPSLMSTPKKNVSEP